MIYSIDFRWQVFSMKEKEGLSYEQTANRFDIGKTTLVRWRKRFVPARSRNKATTKINIQKPKYIYVEPPYEYVEILKKNLFGTNSNQLFLRSCSR